MYAEKGPRWRREPRLRRIISLLVLVSFLLVACGTGVQNANWPGLTADDNVVYVAYGAGVIAVDVAEQELLWSFPDEPRAGLLFYAPPSVSEEAVILGDFGVSGGFFSPRTRVTVYALEPGASGGAPDVLWSRDDVATDRIVASPLQADERVYVGTSDNRVVALDAASGEPIWEYETGHSVWAQPVSSEGVLYVASLDNFVYALDAASGDLLWQTELGGSIAGGLVLDDDVLYVPSFDRAVHALDAGSGEELWRAEATNWVWGAPTVNDSFVYYGDLDGNVFAASREGGEILWQGQVPGVIQSAPLYSDGRLFVAAGDIGADEETQTGRIVAFDAESGDELWQQSIPAPVLTHPVMVGSGVVVAINEGATIRLLVFDPESGAQTWSYTPPVEG